MLPSFAVRGDDFYRFSVYLQHECTVETVAIIRREISRANSPLIKFIPVAHFEICTDAHACRAVLPNPQADCSNPLPLIFTGHTMNPVPSLSFTQKASGSTSFTFILFISHPPNTRFLGLLRRLNFQDHLRVWINQTSPVELFRTRSPPRALTLHRRQNRHPMT